jgi:ABC-2 type transport system ATP-binding protein
MLVIDSVSRKFRGGNYGVRDFSLSFDSGVLGLLGPNGAGKTTLMQMVATLLRPTAGSIAYNGTDIVQSPDFLRQRLGYLPQDFGVYDNLTAREFISYFASLKGAPAGRVTEMLEVVNLHSEQNRMVGAFSGGMKQRLGIAQALINDPELLIVDEPTAGLDPEERVRFRNILSEIGAGKTVILSTHIVSDVESIATDIAIMKHGRLLAYEKPEILLRRAAGRVWEAILPSVDFQQVRGRFPVSRAVHRSDGVHARIVALQEPVPGAVPAEPDLEEAFLQSIHFDDSTATPATT